MASVGVLPIMGHAVLGYPSLAASLATATAYAEAGFTYLELQIPFSHPTADGPTIVEANQQALAAGATYEACLQQIASLHARFPDTRIVVMSYANKLLARGVEALHNDLLAAGVYALIVPDLDLAYARQLGLGSALPGGLVPVFGPNPLPDRLALLEQQPPQLVYLMAGYKLTGSGFGLDGRLPALIQQLKGYGVQQVGIGFGISTPQDVQTVLQAADFAIIGSALLRAQQQGKLTNYLAELAGTLGQHKPQ